MNVVRIVADKVPQRRRRRLARVAAHALLDLCVTCSMSIKTWLSSCAIVFDVHDDDDRGEKKAGIGKNEPSSWCTRSA